MLFKYRSNQIVTKAEMLAKITRAYDLSHHAVFTKASDCMWLLFRIDVAEVYPLLHSYSFVPALGITYGRIQHSTMFLGIIILCTIFLLGNYVSEEELLHMLNRVVLYAGTDHSRNGEPRRLITEHFVQEG